MSEQTTESRNYYMVLVEVHPTDRRRNVSSLIREPDGSLITGTFDEMVAEAEKLIRTQPRTSEIHVNLKGILFARI